MSEQLEFNFVYKCYACGDRVPEVVRVMQVGLCPACLIDFEENAVWKS